MEFLQVTTPMFCGIAPFALGWILFCAAVGVRAGWEAGIRLFLLGIGLLGVFLLLGTLVFWLSNWLAIPLALLVAALPWLTTLRYLLYQKAGGKLLLALPIKDEKYSTLLMNGIILMFWGLSLLRVNTEFVAPPKSYGLALSLISWGSFLAIRRYRASQIRERGILNEFGSFYRWENIESYSWKYGEDKLTLKLKKPMFWHTVQLKILSQYRHEVVAHLTQQVDNMQSTAQAYLPSQKAG